ncbi:MAG: CRISPR-associated protein [Thermoproteus sp.]
MKVVIRPLGYARLAARPPSTPTVAARDAAAAAPPPSTLLGLLGALAGVTMQCPGNGPEAAESQLKQLAEALGVGRIWGPLVEIDGALHVPGTDRLYRIEPSGAVAKPVGIRELRVVRRIGLALRPDKTAALGYLYSATYVAERAAYIYHVEARGLKGGGLARLGGEGRLAAVEIQDGPLPIQPPSRVDGTALVISPLLAPDGQLPDCLKPLGTLKEGRRGVEKDHKVKLIQWGLGFSEVCRERRPMYPALPPGTVVEARGCGSNEGYLAELGYGALLPIEL